MVIGSTTHEFLLKDKNQWSDFCSIVAPETRIEAYKILTQKNNSYVVYRNIFYNNTIGLTIFIKHEDYRLLYFMVSVLRFSIFI